MALLFAESVISSHSQGWQIRMNEFTMAIRLVVATEAGPSVEVAGIIEISRSGRSNTIEGA